MSGAPRYWTRPTPGAPNDLAAHERLARVLNRPLMPWQRLVIRVGTERECDDPRRFRYPLVIVSVPRQAGKTTQAHVKNTHRTMVRRQQAFYTAQTGKDARERWFDAKQLVEQSPLKRFVEKGNHYGGAIQLGAGMTSITWPGGGQLRPFAPTAASLHGYTPDTVDEDEVWAYDELQGEALDGAIGPAQITLPWAQRWMYSTMGDADSTYWHRLVDRGRLATEDPAARVAYFEWSADERRDLYDPANWSFHPALGHTIDLRDLRDRAENESEGVWSRAYCNLRTAGRESVIDARAFAKLGDTTLRLVGKTSQLAYDVDADSAGAAIALAGRHGEDGVAVRIVRAEPGVAWLADAVCDLADKLGLSTLHADDGGPTRDVTAVLRRRGRDVETTSGTDYATACGAWLRRARDGRLKHDGSKVLTDAMDAAVLRPMGDAVAFSRVHSKGPIAALVAGAVAARAAILAPVPVGPPRAVFAA